jgi:glycosyltransferase involved in cell wall biosynthesis
MEEVLPGNVLMKSHDPLELRELYQNARFVVMPLLPSDTDNGITVILEAMSAGKTVICTRTKGQVDAIEDGVTGILVDGGDPAPKRAANHDQWHDSEKAERLGRNARDYIETSRHLIERFTEDVKDAACEIVADGGPLAT